MAREACIVLETVSRGRAKEIATCLSTGGFDIEREEDVVLCFVNAPAGRRQRRHIRERRQLARRALAEAQLLEALVREPVVRLWNEERRRYVDLHHEALEDEDWVRSDLSPAEITYVVDVVPASAFELKATRRALRRLRRPIVRGGLRSLLVGARDESDAAQLASKAGLLSVVRSATPRALGRWQRWLLRQRVQGNYASEGGDYLFLQGMGVTGGGGGDGGGGGGNGGGS